jgi:membrane protein
VLGTVSLSWSELGRRTWREALDDDVPGLAAQLAYYFFLALFPAVLFLLALASFFPLENVTDDVGRSLGPFVSPQVLELLQEQMRRLANNDNGGLLSFGVAAALWSSSAALVSIIGAVNRAYDIEEERPWWKVRLVAIGLTLGLAVIVLVAFSLVLAGPALAERLGQITGWGAPFEWTWLVLQWPLVFVLVTTGIGLIFYFGPDADQDWVWISPGAVAATILWLLVSLLFKLYIANFTDYEALYGTVGGVIVVLLWFYISGIAILAGAELNAEIEHASPYGKAPGQKNAQGKLLIGRRAARAFRERQRSIESTLMESPPTRASGSHPTIQPERTTTPLAAPRALPSAEQTAPRHADLVRAAVNAIVTVGWMRLAWKSTRTLRRAAVGAVVIGVALVLGARRARD